MIQCECGSVNVYESKRKKRCRTIAVTLSLFWLSLLTSSSPRRFLRHSLFCWDAHTHHRRAGWEWFPKRQCKMKCP